MNNKNYVFKQDGNKIKYIGDFDGLYKNVEDPWGQINDPYYRRCGSMIIDTLRELNPLSVLDIGCGLGWVTQLIDLLITRDVIGYDISAEAIKRAKKMYPSIEFDVLNILKDTIDKKADAIVMSGVLWYILDDLDGVMAKLNNSLNYLGHLIIFQTFINDQKWGKDKVDGYKGFLQYLCGVKGFRIVKSLYCDTGDRRTDSITVLQRWGGDSE